MATMSDSLSVGTPDITFTMSDDSWGAKANLPWLKDTANTVLNDLGITQAVNGLLASEAQLVIPTMNDIGSAIGNAMSSLFGGSGGFNLGGSNSSVYSHTDTYGQYKVTNDNGRVTAVDLTTGQSYPSVGALYSGRYQAQGYPENVANAIASIQMGGQPPAALKAALDKYIAQDPNNGMYVYGNQAYGVDYASTLRNMYNKTVGTPSMQAERVAQLKASIDNGMTPSQAYSSYVGNGNTLGPAEKQFLQQAQADYKAKLANDPQYKDVAAKYSSTNLPKVGTNDAVLYAKYLGLPDATIAKLTNAMFAAQEQQARQQQQATNQRDAALVAASQAAQRAQEAMVAKWKDQQAAALTTGAADWIKEYLGQGVPAADIPAYLQQMGYPIDDQQKALLEDAKVNPSKYLFSDVASQQQGAQPAQDPTAAFNAQRESLIAAEQAKAEAARAAQKSQQDSWDANQASVMNKWASDWTTQLLGQGKSADEITQFLKSQGLTLGADQQKLLDAASAQKPPTQQTGSYTPQQMQGFTDRLKFLLKAFPEQAVQIYQQEGFPPLTTEQQQLVAQANVPTQVTADQAPIPMGQPALQPTATAQQPAPQAANSPLSMSSVSTPTPTQPVGETVEQRNARWAATAQASKDFAAQQQAAGQAKITAMDQAFTDAKAQAPAGAFGDMTSTQWSQMAPEAQTSFLANAQTWPQQKAAMDAQTAANKAADALLPYPNAQTDAERSANIQAYYSMNGLQLNPTVQAMAGLYPKPMTMDTAPQAPAPMAPAPK